MSRIDDIKTISHLLDGHYDEAGACAFAGIGEDTRKSIYYEGDSDMLMNLLCDLAADVIAKISDTRIELGETLESFAAALDKEARKAWDELRRTPDVTAYKVDLTEEQRKRLLN